jgi:hypothetical protein
VPEPHPLPREQASLAVVLTAARPVELMTPLIVGPRVAGHLRNFGANIAQQNSAREFGAEIAHAVVLAEADQIPIGRLRVGVRWNPSHTLAPSSIIDASGQTNLMSNHLLTT